MISEVISAIEGMTIDDHMGQQYISMSKKIQAIMSGCSVVDICFFCDITGSMDTYLKLMRNAIKDILHSLRQNSSIFPRIAFLGFRDKKDTVKYEFQDFTFSPETVLAKIDSIKCTGGDDACEDIVGALQKAISLSWVAPSKFLVIIVDAPTHGRNYHEPGVLDDYPEDDKAPINLEYVTRHLSKNEVKPIVFKCRNDVDKMLDVMASCYGKYGLKNYIFPLSESAGTTFAELQKRFVDHSSSSITTMWKTEFSQGSVSRSDQKVSGTLGAWSPMIMPLSMEFTMHTASLAEEPVFEAESMKVPIKFVEIAKSVFDLGIEQKASGTFKECYQLQQRGTNAKYIAKIVKKNSSIFSREDIRNDMENYLIACYFAKLFNRAMKRDVITILPVIALEISQRDTERAKIFNYNRFFTAEQFIPGEYHKFQNNSGWVNEKLAQEDWGQIAHAFSHFSFCYSSGTLIIVDLQGTMGGSQLCLTDPAIHCATKLKAFGRTNRKALGIAQFFLSHKCNKYCKGFQLPQVKLPAAITLSMQVESLANSDTSMPPLKDPLKAREERKEADISIALGELKIKESELQAVLEKIVPIERVVIVEKFSQQLGGNVKKAFVNLKNKDDLKKLMDATNGDLTLGGKEYEINIKRDPDLIIRLGKEGELTSLEVRTAFEASITKVTAVITFEGREGQHYAKVYLVDSSRADEIVLKTHSSINIKGTAYTLERAKGNIKGSGYYGRRGRGRWRGRGHYQPRGYRGPRDPGIVHEGYPMHESHTGEAIDRGRGDYFPRRYRGRRGRYSRGYEEQS